MKNTRLFLVLGFALAPTLHAELQLPAIISDHMVLQQKQPNPIWGWDTPGTTVTVTFSGQTHTAKAASTGRWEVKLSPLAASATPQTLTINGTTNRKIEDVLVGEV
jgi:sialate O-acetylesterase